MEEEKMNFNILESIQMCNFIMKKELSSKLIEEIDLNKHLKKQKQRLKTFVNFFIEDLFNIINQQLLTYTQIYESLDESKIEDLIINNKALSFNMILNFFNKIFTILKDKIKSNYLSRNHISEKKYNNLLDKNISVASSNDKSKKLNNSNNLGDFYVKQKYRTNISSLYNSIQNSQKNSRKNSYSNINNLIINRNNSYSSKNILNYKTNKVNNIKPFYINLDNLKESDGKNIEIYIKSKKTNILEYGAYTGGRKSPNNKPKNVKKEFNGKNNYNNHIIFIKQIYKGCNSSSAKRYKDYLKNEQKKNSFNQKIKINKISIENSKIHLKNIKPKQNEKLNNIIIKNNLKSYKPFKPRNFKGKNINNIEINICNNNCNNNNYDYHTQRFQKINFDNMESNIKEVNKNTYSEKIMYKFSENDLPKSKPTNFLNSNFTDKNNDKEIGENKKYNFIEVSPYSFEPIHNSLNYKDYLNENENLVNISFNKNNI